MANGYSADDLLEFLDHAGDKGLMPAATAQALAVATRNVLAIHSDDVVCYPCMHSHVPRLNDPGS